MSKIVINIDGGWKPSFSLLEKEVIDKQDGKSRINPRVMGMLGNHTIFATCMYVKSLFQ